MVGGVNVESFDARTPLVRVFSNSFWVNNPGTLPSRAFSPSGEILFSVLVLLYTTGFTPLFAAGFAAGFGSIFEVKPAAKPFGNIHSPSIFSGKQYIGIFFLRDPRLNPIKPFITSLSLPADNVFSVTAISATARGLEREKGFSHPRRLQISSNRKYIFVSVGVKPLTSTSCQYRLINSI